jgi:membrane protein DedA with SNARE-associated domain
VTLASLSSTSEQLVQQLGYFGLVITMAVEHIFPPIPSELVLPLAGFEVARGNLNLFGALVAATLGSLVGASVLYFIARRGGRPLVLRLRGALRVDEPALERAERRFERHSAWIVLLGRMVPGLRSIVSLPPGLLRMPFGRYLALTATGSLAWNALLIVLGQQLGSRWSDVAGWVAPIAQIVLIACVPLVVGWMLVRRQRRARAQVQ